MTVDPTLTTRPTTSPGPRTRGRLLAAVVLVLSLLATGLVFALGPTEATTTDSANRTLPSDSDSAEVARLRESLPSGRTAPAVVVFSRTDDRPLTSADLAAVRERVTALLSGAEPEVVPGGLVATLAVPLPTDLDLEQVTEQVDRIRGTATQGLVPPLQAQVTGGPAFAADLVKVFEGADVRLLAITALVVAVLLLLTYRSPVLWIVPLLVVGTGDRLASVVVGALAPRFDITIDGAAAGILSVLVFGAGTNYALLLVSRYRDELRGTADRYRAMRRALRATAPAVLASGSTVALSLLTLLAADLDSNRGLGFAGAVGICIAMAFGLVVLPAALVLPGRWLFWPRIPRVGDPTTAERAGGWSRLGAAVARRPAAVAVTGVVVLVALAAPLIGARTGLEQTQSFRVVPEAVQGQQTLERVLPGGTAQPLVVLSTPAAAEQVLTKARTVPGVAQAATGERTAELAVTTVVLDAAPGTDASDTALRALRERLTTIEGADARVGGPTAELYDIEQANARDTRVVVPLVLAIVFIVLAALLRALVAPLLLVATVVASYGAALGAGWLLFDRLYGFPALDTSVPLLSFLFLVALGVDYNIFLIARTREDVLRGLPTRRAIRTALSATGEVITSAGVLLAAVFAVLGVLPLLTLTQIGVVVGIGVLLDTLLVRTVLVPALVLLTGRQFWWPGRPEADDRNDVPGAPAAPLGAPEGRSRGSLGLPAQRDTALSPPALQRAAEPDRAGTGRRPSGWRLVAASTVAILAVGTVTVGPAQARPAQTPRPVAAFLTGAALPGANGLALDQAGRLWVASTGASRITVLNPATGAVLDRFGPEQGVVYPEDLALGPDGAMYWTGLLTGDVGRILPDGTGERVGHVGPGANPITFTDDGRLFVGRCIFGDGLYELDPTGQEPVRVIAEGIGAGCGLNGMDVGPDGRIYGPQPLLRRIVAVDPDSGALEVVADGFGPLLFAVKFAPDGALIALDGPAVTRLDLASGARTVSATLGFVPDNLVITASGRTFVSSVSTAEVIELDPAEGQRTVSPGGLAVPQGLASGQDGLRVATAAGLTTFDAATGLPRGFVPAAVPNAVGSLSARGELSVTASPFGGSVALFDSAAGTARTVVTGLDWPVDAVLLDDDVVVAEAGAGQVVRIPLARPQERQVLLKSVGAPAGLAVSDGDLWVSDVLTGQVQQVLRRGALLRTPRLVASGLDRPQALAAQGRTLLVLESGQGQVLAVGPSRRPSVLLTGLTPANPPLPGRPTDGLFAGLTAEPSGQVLVSDPITNRVLAAGEPGRR